MSKALSIQILVFWLVLASFLVWDWYSAEPVNLRLESSIIALGSGQAPSGGHCSSF